MNDILKQKDKKVFRVIDIYSRLSDGNIINKKRLAEEFKVNEKTIQRDLEDIKCYYTEHREALGEIRLKYDRSKKGYKIDKDPNKLLMKDILVLIKILLESRSLCGEELSRLVNGLLIQINKEERGQLKEIIGNELLNYIPVTHNQHLINKISSLAEHIRYKSILEIKYINQNSQIKKREIKPVSIIFSEYYFYLIGYIEKFKSPTVFRIDRIIEFKNLNKKFVLENSELFADGEFRKRAQFMYGGDLQRIKFEYYGTCIEAVKDKLPTANVKTKDENYLVEAEVYGDGIIMWLLSQGSKIKLLEPVELVEKIKQEVKRMGSFYE